METTASSGITTVLSTPEEAGQEWDCLGEQVLVRRIEDEADLTPGGIVKPQIAKLTSNKGIVVAVGEGRLIGDQLIPWGETLKPGDEIRFSRHGGTDVPMDDGEVLLLFHWKQIFLKKKAHATL
jgi:chaperonin GroES